MNDEHVVAIVSFEGAVKREVKRIREALRPAVEAKLMINDFGFQIKVSGRVLDGEVKLSYKIGEYDFMAKEVEGDSPNAVVDEFLRRKGWASIHAPLAISMDKQKPLVETEDEIPF